VPIFRLRVALFGTLLFIPVLCWITVFSNDAIISFAKNEDMMLPIVHPEKSAISIVTVSRTIMPLNSCVTRWMRPEKARRPGASMVFFGEIADNRQSSDNWH
jgi:hypothetical protein